MQNLNLGGLLSALKKAECDGLQVLHHSYTLKVDGSVKSEEIIISLCGDLGIFKLLGQEEIQCEGSAVFVMDFIIDGN